MRNMIRTYVTNKKIYIAILLLCVLTIVLISNFYPEDEVILEDSKDEKIDISYTYQVIEDGNYKIYPVNMSYLALEGDGLRMEYLKSELKSSEVLMKAVESHYTETKSISTVMVLPIANKLEIITRTSIDQVVVDNNLDVLIEQWRKVRELSLDNPENTHKYLLEFTVDNQEIVSIRLVTFDVYAQNTD